MAKQEWTIGEIEVDVSGHFTTHHYLRSKSGDLGEITFPAFARQATYLTLDGHELQMHLAHWLGSSHELEENGMVRGRADQPGFFRQDLAIEFDGQQYSLEPEGFFRQGWRLFDAERNHVLAIHPRGLFKQGAILEITGSVDADLVVFAYYLYYVREQEMTAAGAAAAS